MISTPCIPSDSGTKPVVPDAVRQNELHQNNVREVPSDFTLTHYCPKQASATQLSLLMQELRTTNKDSNKTALTADAKLHSLKLLPNEANQFTCRSFEKSLCMQNALILWNIFSPATTNLNAYLKWTPPSVSCS